MKPPPHPQPRETGGEPRLFRIQSRDITAVAMARCGEGSGTGYPWAMAKSQDKKRTDKKNKPKLSPKEKKAKKAAKKGK